MITYIKLTLTAIFWGGTFVAGRFIASDVSPVNAAFLRFAIASFFLIIFTKNIEGKFPAISRKQILPILLSGASGVFLYNILFFEGLRYIHAGRAALIIALNPIMISIFSAILFREKLNFIKGFGIILSVTGALVVISNGHLTDIMGYHIGKGELLIFGCVVSWVSYSLVGKAVMSSLSPLVSVCYSSVAGTALLAIPFLFNGQFHEIINYTILDWGNLFYLGFFGTVLGFFWYYEGINRIGAMKAGVFINVVPVSAIILSCFILDEAITPSLFSGGVFVISGVYTTNASQTIKSRMARLIHAVR
ncbi:Permease of the drug/metabolite transporter (DMT) superfamily [Desulfocicer vacuolatum DSM 3385]|uniref:Permease of the drug/metabolite transporter (DMT) superfamily n=1 Tax=Desulfocicer vacuolatum DSM 3385 TaxID=1121400 RepID=A0A1W2BIQ5_9BACT|nr:EamA family transporter [Desulfocicer vacuolatum]SMC72328.1 Permease of the drug/metabolite transporter (DMT) superfamily [Desulfocicer vacuolatum DSM 3385]